MTKTRSKQPASITTSERIIFTVCAIIIGSTFILVGPFFMFSAAILLVLIVDLIMLMGGRVSEAIKRLLLLISIFAALGAAIILANVYLFQ